MCGTKCRIKPLELISPLFLVYGAAFTACRFIKNERFEDLEHDSKWLKTQILSQRTLADEHYSVMVSLRTMKPITFSH